MKRLWGIAFFCVLLAGDDALAQAADTSTKVDFGPFIIQYVLPALGTILTALAGWAVQQLAKKYNIQMNATMKGALDDAVTHGLAYAQSRVVGAANAGAFTVDVKNQVVASALTYATAHAPDAIKHLGYTPDMVAQKIEATLSFNMTPPAQSAAIPTPPAA